MATISLCMIVKNEEKVLSRCLDSVKDAVDEIIIADTGSDDRTKEIALEYTPFVYDFEWTDDFSAARNFSFSKATKDYIMWLDADDVLTPENLKKLIALKKSLKTADCVMLKYNTSFDENGNPTFSYYRERLFRRTSPHEWKGRVHEAVECSGNTVYGDAEINHKSIKTEYSTRNLDIYEKQLASGEEMTPRDTFYYGRELFYHKKYDRAIKVLTDFLEDGRGWKENNIEACKVLSLCYSSLNMERKAVNALLGSFLYDNPRADVCCRLGVILMNISLYDKAIFWFELAMRLPKNEKSGAFIDLDSYGYTPCINLCVCYDRIGDQKRAEQYNVKAGEYRPDSAAYLHNLNYFRQNKPN